MNLVQTWIPPLPPNEIIFIYIYFIIYCIWHVYHYSQYYMYYISLTWLTHPLSGAQVGTRLHRSLMIRITMAADFRSLTLAWERQARAELSQRGCDIQRPSFLPTYLPRALVNKINKKGVQYSSSLASRMIPRAYMNARCSQLTRLIFLDSTKEKCDTSRIQPIV